MCSEAGTGCTRGKYPFLQCRLSKMGSTTIYRKERNIDGNADRVRSSCFAFIETPTNDQCGSKTEIQRKLQRFGASGKPARMGAGADKGTAEIERESRQIKKVTGVKKKYLTPVLFCYMIPEVMRNERNPGTDIVI